MEFQIAPRIQFRHVEKTSVVALSGFWAEFIGCGAADFYLPLEHHEIEA